MSFSCITSCGQQKNLSKYDHYKIHANSNRELTVGVMLWFN